MLSTNLSNFITRSTRVTAINEDGDIYKVLPNAKINFLQDLESLKKQAALTIRLHKDEPMHNVEKITLKHAGEDVLLSPEVLDELKCGKRTIDFNSAAEKFNITIYIKNKEGEPAVSRVSSKTTKTRSLTKKPAEDQENTININTVVATTPISLQAKQSQNQLHPPSPGRPRPGSASRRRTATSPAVTRRIVPPSTPKAPLVIHNRQSPPRNDSKQRMPIVESEVVLTLLEVPHQDIQQAVLPPNESAEVVPTELAENPVNCNEVSNESHTTVGTEGASEYHAPLTESEIEIIWREVPTAPGIYSPSPMRTQTSTNAHTPCTPSALLHQPATQSTIATPQTSTLFQCSSDVCAMLTATESIDEETNHIEDDCADDNYDGECEHSPPPATRENDQSTNDDVLNKQTPGKSRTPRMLKRSASKPVVQDRSMNLSLTNESLYPDGRTMAEVGRAYTNSMRSYESQPRGHATTTTTRKASTSTPGKSAKKETKKESDPEGRPSLGTLTMQWQFMRANFLKGDEDELEWLMVSKKPGAYKHAHKKYCNAEDKYYRSLCETELTEVKVQLLAGAGKQLLAAIGTGCTIHLSLQVTPTNEDMMSQALEMQTTIKNLLFPGSSSSTSNDNSTTLLNVFSANTQKILKQLCDETNRIRIARMANSLDKIINEEAKDIPARLMTILRDGEEALKDMEKWSKREVETDDYAESMKEQETEWFATEEQANLEALQIMRCFIPIGIAEMTSDMIQTRIGELNGLYSLELIAELRKNKLLHWITMHRDDIAMANFLAGDSKQYFENIEAYDIIELRAIALCLPDKFELDGDGKKLDWRSRIMNRTKQLASQQNRELVKGAWDAAAGKRQMIALPPLKSEQERRAMYYYRTKAQNDLKLKQYVEKEALLKKKSDLLKTAELEATENKKEYDTLLIEMRDPDFKAIYGAEKLVALKEIAKSEWVKSDNKRKQLLQDVNRIQKAILDNPISQQQFQYSSEELRSFLDVKGINWDEATTPVLISGAFDPSIPITKTERRAAKCLSAEEEAEIRRAELSGLTNKKVDEPDELVVDGTSISAEVPEFVHVEVKDASVPASANDSAIIVADVDSKPTINNFTPGRRGSILSTVNKDMLSCLNKMLSGSSASNSQTPFASPAPRSTTSRMSMLVATPGSQLPQTPGNRRASVAGDGTPMTLDNIAKKTQSKLLKKALEASVSESRAPDNDEKAAPVLKPLSFLDQIKLGKSKRPAADGEAAVCADGPPVAPSRPPMAALFGLGNGAPGVSLGGSGGIGGAVSFLDAIRARKKD